MTRAKRQNINDKGISEGYFNNAEKVFTTLKDLEIR
jgi:hypothetical protein